jgi:hypothetical protein
MLKNLASMIIILRYKVITKSREYCYRSTIFPCLYNKYTESYKRDEVIKNQIKKSAIIFLLFSFCWGCSQDENEVRPVSPFQCINSQSRCEVITEFGLVVLKFNTEKVLTELPFSLLVEFKESDLPLKGMNQKDHHKKNIKVLGYMEGKTMFMGKIPLFFNTKGESKANKFVAETMLGSCSEDKMTWRLWLTIEMNGTNNEKLQTTFFIDFDSTRF